MAPQHFKQRNATTSKQSQTVALSQESEIPYAQVWDALKAVIGVLTASNVDYFLMAGSLLGFSRSNDTQNPWMDSDIDLAVATSWLKTPGHVENLRHDLTSAGFVWSKNYKGVDGTALTLGGSQCYTRHNVTVELVATDVSSNFHINGFRHEHYRLGCPKPYNSIKEVTWGKLLVIRSRSYSRSYGAAGYLRKRLQQPADIPARVRVFSNG